MSKDDQPTFYEGISSFLKEMELLKGNDKFSMYLWKTDEHIRALRKMGYDINQNVFKPDCFYVRICGGKVTNSSLCNFVTNCPKFDNWAEMVKYILGVRRARKNADLLLQKSNGEKGKPETKEEIGELERLMEYASCCAFPYLAKLRDGGEFFIRGMTKRELIAMHLLSSWKVNEFADEETKRTQVKAALDYADIFLEEAVKCPKL